MTENIIKSLQFLGLTQNEIKIYLFLLKKGVAEGKELITELKIDKSSAYEAVANLTKKELIFSLGQKRNQQFGAIPANKLLEIVETKNSELLKVKNDINNLIVDLEEYSKQNYKNKNIRIFEGHDGFEKWAYARLEAPRGSIIRDLSLDGLQESFTKTKEDYKRYSIDMPVERVEAGIYMHGFMKKSDIEKEIVPKSINRSDPKFLKEIRLLPEDFSIDCSLVTFANCTSFLRVKEGVFFGIILEDKFITATINTLLDYIWKDLKRI